MRKFCFLLLLSGLCPLYGADDPGTIVNQLSSLASVQSASQAIIIIGTDPNKSNAQTFLFEKKEGKWTILQDGFPAAVGKIGFAPIGEKREGDMKSPTGVFALSLAFGYAPSCDTKMPYRQSTKDDFWVDDSNSPQYNTWVHGSLEAKSAEKMFRKDICYKLGIVVDYNTNPIVPGKGSAIFLHVWRKPGSITAGCAAFAEENIIRILEWLDPDKKPIVIMGVPEEIKKLTKRD